MGKKSTSEVSEIVEQEALYATVFELKEFYGSLKLPISTPNDIKAITERQKFFDEVVKEFTDKVNGVQVPEGLSEEEVIEFRKGKVNEIAGQPCGVKKEQLEMFTADEFVSAIRDLSLSNLQLMFLNHWLVKA